MEHPNQYPGQKGCRPRPASWMLSSATCFGATPYHRQSSQAILRTNRKERYSQAKLRRRSGNWRSTKDIVTYGECRLKYYDQGGLNICRQPPSIEVVPENHGVDCRSTPAKHLRDSDRSETARVPQVARSQVGDRAAGTLIPSQHDASQVRHADDRRARVPSGFKADRLGPASG